MIAVPPQNDLIVGDERRLCAEPVRGKVEKAQRKVGFARSAGSSEKRGRVAESDTGPMNGLSFSWASPL